MVHVVDKRTRKHRGGDGLVGVCDISQMIAWIHWRFAQQVAVNGAGILAQKDRHDPVDDLGGMGIHALQDEGRVS